MGISMNKKGQKHLLVRFLQLLIKKRNILVNGVNFISILNGKAFWRVFLCFFFKTKKWDTRL